MGEYCGSTGASSNRVYFVVRRRVFRWTTAAWVSRRMWVNERVRGVLLFRVRAPAQVCSRTGWKEKFCEVWVGLKAADRIAASVVDLILRWLTPSDRIVWQCFFVVHFRMHAYTGADTCFRRTGGRLRRREGLMNAARGGYTTLPKHVLARSRRAWCFYRSWCLRSTAKAEWPVTNPGAKKRKTRRGGHGGPWVVRGVCHGRGPGEKLFLLLGGWCARPVI